MRQHTGAKFYMLSVFLFCLPFFCLPSPKLSVQHLKLSYDQTHKHHEDDNYHYLKKRKGIEEKLLCSVALPIWRNG